MNTNFVQSLANQAIQEFDSRLYDAGGIKKEERDPLSPIKPEYLDAVSVILARAIIAHLDMAGMGSGVMEGDLLNTSLPEEVETAMYALVDACKAHPMRTGE